jgi:hypothetical protein
MGTSSPVSRIVAYRARTVQRQVRNFFAFFVEYSPMEPLVRDFRMEIDVLRIHEVVGCFLRRARTSYARRPWRAQTPMAEQPPVPVQDFLVPPVPADEAPVAAQHDASPGASSGSRRLDDY